MNTTQIILTKEDAAAFIAEHRNTICPVLLQVVAEWNEHTDPVSRQELAGVLSLLPDTRDDGVSLSERRYGLFVGIVTRILRSAYGSIFEHMSTKLTTEKPSSPHWFWDRWDRLLEMLGLEPHQTALRLCLRRSFEYTQQLTVTESRELVYLPMLEVIKGAAAR